MRGGSVGWWLSSGVMSVLCLLTAPAALASPADNEAWRALRQEARAHEHGEGVPRDAARAVALYCETARQGDAEAQFSLGWMYANARGVPRSDETASAFFQLAASQGHEQAQKMLRFVGEVAGALPDCMKPPEPEADPEEEDIFTASTPAQEKIYELVRKLAPEFGVNPSLVMAVIKTESNFSVTALSAKNAQGLMQLIPETALRFNVKKPFDPEQNIRGGLSYLRWLLAYFEGDVSLVAAAYNAGEGAVNRYRGVPPYAETRDYVRRIRQLFRRSEHPFDPAITQPSPEMPRIRLAKKAP